MRIHHSLVEAVDVYNRIDVTRNNALNSCNLDSPYNILRHEMSMA